MKSYPLYFTFKDVVKCGDSTSLVLAKGRVLMTLEEDEWWLYGVQPGGMAGYGRSQAEAFIDFRKGFKEILEGIASDATSPQEFERVARGFFCAIDKEDERIWEESRQQLRSGNQHPPADLDLKKETEVLDAHINIISIVVPNFLGEDDIAGNEPPYAAAA
jgi:hypothetical protein